MPPKVFKSLGSLARVCRPQKQKKRKYLPYTVQNFLFHYYPIRSELDGGFCVY